MLPFNGRNRVTSIFGKRTLNGITSEHKGLDIIGDDSHDVRAVCGGKVVQSKIVEDKTNRTWEWGNYVCVQVAGGCMHYYCHLSSRAVKAGDVVNEGDKIGVMGNTGKSTGAHLHFEVRDATKVSVSPCGVLKIPNQTMVHTSTPAAKPVVNTFNGRCRLM